MGNAEEDLLQRYFDDELPPEERARFEAAMTEDDRLKLAALAEMRALLATTLDADSGKIDLWAGIEAQQKKARVRRWRDRLSARTAGASAAVMALAAAALLFVFQPWHAGRSENDCDIVSLETDGAVATVFHLTDLPKGDQGTTTVIWTEDD
jgi:anti-sigma factor RsiW